MNDALSRCEVLIIDDEPEFRRSLALNLSAAGYSATEAEAAEQALEQISSRHFDVVLCDHRLPGSEGIELIHRIHEIDAESRVVFMTGYPDRALLLEAIKNGAYEFLLKPFTNDELLLLLSKLEERDRYYAEFRRRELMAPHRAQLGNIVAKSKVMLDVFDTVKRLGPFHTTVLITGESGTGKELIARAIHDHSPRRGKPFIAINCGAIPENLVESELFGHRRGAFTDATRDKRGLFEEANGGTIFLDEIAELPLLLQVKLLRALQEQKIHRVGDEQLTPINVRVIAATLRDLEADTRTGRFRADLFYRLNVVSVHLAPLRERREDIPALVQFFMKKHCKRLGLSIRAVHSDALRAMCDYRWKGNVRELENCIERALVLSVGDELGLSELPEHIKNGLSRESAGALPLGDEVLSIKQRTRALEVQLILRALEQTNGNRTHAAKVLEISHRALLYKLKEYGLTGRSGR